MANAIVTTTINGVTDALDAFARVPDWHLIVVVDRRTPKFSLSGATVLTVEDQEALDRRLSDLIGWNCIQRRNMGFLAAYRWGAQVIASVDDDNFPLETWGQNVRIGLKTRARVFGSETTNWFDPLAITAHGHLWHRGFPLTELRHREYRSSTMESITPDIEASLWLGDPDVDAICRLEHAPIITEFGSEFPFASTLIGPFNSQNTFISRAAIREYFCFPCIGRHDDIWASYHVQAQGFRAIYTAPTVRQERNAHDGLQDVRKEIWGNLRTPDMLRRLSLDRSAVVGSLPRRAREAFNAYRDHVRALDREAGTLAQ